MDQWEWKFLRVSIIPDMTCRKNQYKFNSEHDWLMHCT